MDFLVEWIKDWGYWAVFLGATVEGESVILTASALASLGYLSLYKVMLVAFCTTVVVDQVLFFVGRSYGSSIFEKYPRFKKPSEKAFKFLNRFDLWFILMFRFIYGIRTISPVVIGAARISPARFAPLNVIAAAIWTLISCFGGYLLGDAMINLFHYFAQVQKYIILGFIVIATAFLIRKYRKKQKAGEP